MTTTIKEFLAEQMQKNGETVADIEALSVDGNNDQNTLYSESCDILEALNTLYDNEYCYNDIPPPFYAWTANYVYAIYYAFHSPGDGNYDYTDYEAVSVPRNPVETCPTCICPD